MDHVSVALLDALEKHHPHAYLHIEDWARFDDDEDHNNAAEIALASSRNLRSLRARLLNTSAHIDLRSAALERIVALSPGLEVLEVSNFGLFQGTP
jgi:outer membrane protein TolC